jgi:anti-sigma regulatory factor (Ser/Thr protein kinase)
MSRASYTASLAIGNTIAEMVKVADFVDQFCVAHGIDKNVANDLNLCLDELLNNTISYGYDDQNHHSIMVSLALANREVVIEIKDDGRPFDPRSPVPPIPAGTLHSRKIGGLGRHFVNTLMDGVDYVRVNQLNLVKLTKRLPL